MTRILATLLPALTMGGILIALGCIGIFFALLSGEELVKLHETAMANLDLLNTALKP